MINFNFSKNNVLPEKGTVKEDLQRVLDKLYRCRDLEISNLWQRSVFLSVFIILCFTAHGYIIIESVQEDNHLNLKLLLVGFVLSFVGIIMSIIWICMSKASKAWYEVYEEAIVEFEHKHYAVLGIPFENVMGNMNIKKNAIDRNIFSTNGGSFSPSKINITIGQICFLWWGLSEFLYLISILSNLFDSQRQYIVGLVVFFVMLLLVVFISYFQSWLKSGFLPRK